ncbi:hypothetical protein DP57_5938 [Burkholderia pseudomallei]|nr:hypothetical protein DP57_5938 [Burkholderia pseudomallei]
MRGVPKGMLDPSAHAGWAGCASLGPTEARLWVVKGTRCSTGLDQDFSLADVLEAGLRAKITGLNEREREAVVADCVADTLEQIAELYQQAYACVKEK